MRHGDAEGVELTPSCVEAATELTARVGPDDRVPFEVGNALALALPDEHLDLVTLLR